MVTECQDLFPEARNAPELHAINDRCHIHSQDGHWVVMVSGIVLAHYTTADRMAQAHAMVSLVEQGWADQNDVARAFGYSARTLCRDQRRYEEGGLAALGQLRGYPAGRARLTTSRRQTVHRLKTQGHSHCEIARRLGISETAVRKLLRWLKVATGTAWMAVRFHGPANRPAFGTVVRPTRTTKISAVANLDMSFAKTRIGLIKKEAGKRFPASMICVRKATRTFQCDALRQGPAIELRPARRDGEGRNR